MIEVTDAGAPRGLADLIFDVRRKRDVQTHCEVHEGFTSRCSANVALEHPLWSSPRLRPALIGFDEGICGDDELPHDGCDCDFGGFPGGKELLILGL